LAALICNQICNVLRQAQIKNPPAKATLEGRFAAKRYSEDRLEKLMGVSIR